MLLDKTTRLAVSTFFLAVFLFSTFAPEILAAVAQNCDYNRDNPSLDHAVTKFMDPALFQCAESELKDVLIRTSPDDKETLASTNFLLAGALFGQQLSADIPDSVISEYLVRGFLMMPDWSGKWYFSDVPEFMEMVPPARTRSMNLLECPFDSAHPSLEHARQVLRQYKLYDCAAAEVNAALAGLQKADSTLRNSIAEAYFIMAESNFGLRLEEDRNIDDSIIVNDLTEGFVYSWEYSNEWLFGNSEEFSKLLSLARERAEKIRNKDDRPFYKRPAYIIGGIGAAVAGVVTALLISGNDVPSGGPAVDTIPSFPQPPGN